MMIYLTRLFVEVVRGIGILHTGQAMCVYLFFNVFLGFCSAEFSLGPKKQVCDENWNMKGIRILSIIIQLHPGRLTWNLKMMVWKIIFLFNWVIVRFHVNLPGCKLWYILFAFLFAVCAGGCPSILCDPTRRKERWLETAAFGVIEKCKQDVTVLSAYNIIYILDITTYQFYQHICIYICDICLYIYIYYQHFQIFLSLRQCSKKHQKVTMKVAHNSCDPRYSHSYHICWSSTWWFFGGSYGQGWMGLAQVVEVARSIWQQIEPT